MASKTLIGFLIGLSLLAGRELWAQGSGGKPAKTYSRSYGRTGFLFDTAVYYGQSEASANPAAANTWQNTTSLYDIKLGYIMENSLFFGAEYCTRTDNQVSITSTSGTGTGVGIGYFYDNGFNLRAYYKFGETYGNYSEGSGYQADLGYMINMTSNFYMGLALSIRQTSFGANSTISNYSYWTRKETYPFFTLGFLIN